VVSRKALLALPGSAADCISQHSGLLEKSSLLSFNVMNALGFARHSTFSFIPSLLAMDVVEVETICLLVCFCHILDEMLFLRGPVHFVKLQVLSAGMNAF